MDKKVPVVEHTPLELKWICLRPSTQARKPPVATEKAEEEISAGLCGGVVHMSKKIWKQ
jgi:hypothetical protein